MIHSAPVSARRRASGAAAVVALLSATGMLALAGCAGSGYDPAGAQAGLVEAPLGGEALLQRRQDLQRALRDLRGFHATMSSLVDRRDSRSIGLFDGFLAIYLDSHLDPLLRSEWQSNHAELAAIDASLRFAKAELLIQMRYPRRVQRVIDELERRYEGRDDLLVEYPIGRQGKLGDGLELLRDRKWMG